MWLICHHAVPTKSFLNKRGGLLKGNVLCQRCGRAEEDLEYIFSKCPLALSIWKKVGSWWGTVLPIPFNEFPWSWMSHIKDKSLKVGWSTIITSACWTLWLIRNDLVFLNKKAEETEIFWLIKHRAFKWLEASGVLRSEHYNIWFVNPRWPLQSSYYLSTSPPFIPVHAISWIARVDGSWKRINQETKAGIGGYIRKTGGDISFIFSGPVWEKSSLETELVAILFVIKAFMEKGLNQDNILILSDSKNAMENLLNNKSRSWLLEDKFRTFDGLKTRCKRLTIQYSPRELNRGADELAKAGLLKTSMLHQWC